MFHIKTFPINCVVKQLGQIKIDGTISLVAMVAPIMMSSVMSQCRLYLQFKISIVTDEPIRDEMHQVVKSQSMHMLLLGPPPKGGLISFSLSVYSSVCLFVCLSEDSLCLAHFGCIRL